MLRLIIDSCLHHLQAILTGFLAGLGSLEYSHSQATHAKVLAYPGEKRNCNGGSGSWSSAVFVPSALVRLVPLLDLLLP